MDEDAASKACYESEGLGESDAGASGLNNERGTKKVNDRDQKREPQFTVQPSIFQLSASKNHSTMQQLKRYDEQVKQ